MSKPVSSFSADPLISCIITLYTLILLYFPPEVGFTFSPVLVLTAVLLLSLLRLGSVQRLQNPSTDGKENEEKLEISISSSSLANIDTWVKGRLDPIAKPVFEESFIVWDVSAPLEVIYEECEGEEEGQDPDPHPYPIRLSGVDRYMSLSMYYPETDSDSSSGGGFSVAGEWESPEDIRFTWEEEDREGLIEISLDGSDIKDSDFIEEDNLIEIEISPLKDD